MKIAYIGGHWHINIGNSFYNLGALSFLRNTFPQHEIFFVPDPPQELWQGVDSDYKVIPNLDCDLFVFCGPSFNKFLPLVYRETFELLKSKNKKIAFLSVGASEYTETEAEFVIDFLSRYPVEFITTRDKSTYELYKNRMQSHIHDGICTSMYLNECNPVANINGKFYVFNFSYFSEPIINYVAGEYLHQKRGFRSFQQEFLGTKIIRTCSSAAKPFSSLIYNRPNLYWSDLPDGYLSIYKSANIVFSDRVHSCCAALSLGGTAMYFKLSSRSSDGRNRLFDKLGVSEIFHRPQKLNVNYIDDEKAKMATFLNGIL